jgi:hypothetical protein
MGTWTDPESKDYSYYWCDEKGNRIESVLPGISYGNFIDYRDRWADIQAELLGPLWFWWMSDVRWDSLK